MEGRRDNNEGSRDLELVGKGLGCGSGGPCWLAVGIGEFAAVAAPFRSDWTELLSGVEPVKSPASGKAAQI